MPDRARLIVPDALQGLERYHRCVLPDLFRDDPPADQIDPSVQFLFLCFTNRCGSNFLAELMAASGRLNLAEEVYNADTFGPHVRERRLRSFPAYVNFLCDRLQRGKRFASKISLEQLLMLIETGVLDQVVGRSQFLLLERQDRLAQAISLLVAIQNQQWSSAQAVRIPDEALVYSRSIIEEQMARIQAQNFGFYRFFASNDLAPKHLSYEMLVQSPRDHLRDIEAWLGIDGLEAATAALPIHRQDSAVKHAWRERYEAGL
jgi:LPS sulfotransferase NodH